MICQGRADKQTCPLKVLLVIIHDANYFAIHSLAFFYSQREKAS